MKYLKRNSAIRALPLPRKGTKYIARARSHGNFGVPVVIAVRDMLNLARNSKEVKTMVREKLLKINGKTVKDVNESIRIFNVLTADKNYKLTILTNGRFSFDEVPEDEIICKVVNKSLLNKGSVQLNLHDGSNLNSKEKVTVGDSLLLGFDGKIKKVIPIEKGKEVFIISGRSIGMVGEIKEIVNGDVIVNLKDIEREVELHKSHLIAIK